jgi:hypothetical protein
MAWPGAKRGTLAVIAVTNNILVVRRTFTVDLLAGSLDAPVDAVRAPRIS